MKKWLAVSLLALTGCGAELERSSEVETLRVLGVQKSKSYAKAGDEVTFSMLWHDPEGRDITPVWFALDAGDSLLPICVNPPRDSYFSCLGLHAAAFSGVEGVPLGLSLESLSHEGDSITLTVPRSTLEIETPVDPIHLPSLEDCSETDDSCSEVYHPATDAENLPDFGSMFVFFALCPGKLSYDAEVKEGFGLLCLDQNGEPLGPQDFVIGYSQIFLYRDFDNANPVVTGMLVDGEKADACIGTECLDGGTDRPEECGEGVPCLDVCTESDEDNCPEISVKPVIPQTYTSDESVSGCRGSKAPFECDNAQPDEVSQLAYGRNVTEQMWIRYYTDQGRMASEVKLLNDSTTGWNSDYGTDLRLPKEKGPLRLWAVVYDNRGGQDWVRVDAVVR